MAYQNDDPMSGGPSGYYNPEFGMMMIDPSQHQMLAQHFARNGIPVPPDADPDFDHIDAHKALGASLKDQSRAPGMGEASGLPQQGSFDERFSDAMRGAPGSARSYTDPETGQGSETPPAPSMPRPFASSPGASMPVPASPTDVPPQPPQRPKFGNLLNPVRPGAGFPSSIPGAEPWGGRPHVEPEPTAPADAPSTAGGAAVAAGTSQERPGNLNIEDPSAKAVASTEERKEAKASSKADSWDSFGKALAGVSAMKVPTPVFPHPGNIPHPSNQISRSQYPTELLKELSHIGSPAGTVRLGALLKGR